MKKLKRINPSITVSEVNEAFTITALMDRKGGPEFSWMWIECKELDEMWDNSEWLIELFTMILEYGKEPEEVFRRIIESVLYMDDNSVDFVVKHRKSLLEAVKYIKKYW